MNKLLSMLSLTALLMLLSIGTAFATPAATISVVDTNVSTSEFMAEEDVKSVSYPSSIAITAENYDSLKYYISDVYFFEDEILTHFTQYEWIDYTKAFPIEGFGFKQILVAMEQGGTTSYFSLNLNVISPWGDLVYYNDIPHYVNKDGTTSVAVDSNDMVWLKESADGQTAWMGLDNSAGTLPLGSRFSVKWITENDSDYKSVFDMVDNKEDIDSNNALILDFKIESTSGDKYEEFPKALPMFVELPAEWKNKDVQVSFISPASDEAFTEQIVEKEDGRRFLSFSTNHFSPYIVYVKATKDNQPQQNQSDTPPTTEATANTTDTEVSPKTADFGAVAIIKNACTSL